MENRSNIIFNTYTKQFAMCVYENNGLVKALGAGAWPEEETKFLTIPQARYLLNELHERISWNFPTEEQIKRIFNES